MTRPERDETGKSNLEQSSLEQNELKQSSDEHKSEQNDDKQNLKVPDQNFDARMREVLSSSVEFVDLITDDLLTAGGKRIRPTIALLVAQALGVSSKDPKWPVLQDLAICNELLHSASLLHDDLIDDSQTRRGRATAFKRFGNVVSVMSGDFMLSRLLILLSQMPQGQSLTRAFGETASVICEGEVLQFQVAAYADYTLDNYLQIIHGKTAALIALAARSPAVLLQQDETVEHALNTYGLEYGMAFQIQDDLLDLMSDEQTLGKPVGGDLREGKATFPVLLLLETAAANEVRDILERRAAHSGDIERVRALVRQHQTDQAAKAEICRRAELAVSALACLPESEAKQRLSDLATRERTRSY